MYRRLRTINEVIKFIKSKDEGSAVSRYVIENLILERKVYYIKSGVKYLVDLDDVIEVLSLRKEERKHGEVEN